MASTTSTSPETMANRAGRRPSARPMAANLAAAGSRCHALDGQNTRGRSSDARWSLPGCRASNGRTGRTGELAAFDRDSGVDLVDAVTARTALPGVVPTHNINGTRYINGGVRSAENADLATGYANGVVISPFGGRTGPLPAGQFEGLRRFPGADLDSQVEALRKQGSRV